MEKSKGEREKEKADSVKLENEDASPFLPAFTGILAYSTSLVNSP